MKALASARRFLLRLILRVTVRPFMHPAVPVRFRRRWIESQSRLQRPPRGTRVARDVLGGVPVERVVATGQTPTRTLLYVHGGGYQFGTPAMYRPLAGVLARELGAQVVVPAYRRAPEHPFPTPLDDVLAVHAALTSAGFAPDLIAGDSAGAGLTLAATIALRDRGAPLPAAIGLLSPWVDLTCSGESARTEARRDPVLKVSGLRDSACKYAGGRPLDDPGCSPLFADLRGLPPMVVHVASDEILRSDAHRLAESARAAGVPVDLRTYPRWWHVFHLHVGLLPESTEALTDFATALLDASSAGAPRATA
jgi:epsilon-lactone hydrolase